MQPHVLDPMVRPMGLPMQKLGVPASHRCTTGLTEASGLIQPLRAPVPNATTGLATNTGRPLKRMRRRSDTDAPKAKKPKWLCGTVVMVLMQLMTVLYGLMQM